MSYFLAELSAYETDGKVGETEVGDQVVDEVQIVAEVVNFDRDEILIGFNDRGERVYLRIKPEFLFKALLEEAFA